MPGPITIQQAEAVRTALSLNEYQFAVALGYSPTAYLYAKQKQWLSRKMAERIHRKYRRILQEVGK